MSTNLELMFLNIAKETYNLGNNGKSKYCIDNKLLYFNYRITNLNIHLLIQNCFLMQSDDIKFEM